MAKRDYYDVLGISKGADEKEIKRAYRKLAKKYHPDTNPGDTQAEQKFKEVSEAYDVLSDPEKKKLYDQFGFAAFDGQMGADGGAGGFGSGQGGFGWGGTGWGGTDSGQGGGGFRWSGFDTGRDGFGSKGGGQYTEYHFGGDDIFDDILGGMFGGRFQKDSGQNGRRGHDIESDITISFEEAAFGCKKRICFDGSQNQTLEVNIPAGIDEGQSVRLRGKGYPGNGGVQSGDLFLKVHIAQKPGYERKGLDVYTTENIPYTTAVLGGEAVFHTLYGSVKCVVPAGTQSGSKIRLKQKGIVSMKDPKVRGDAFVTIQIEVPKNVTPQERRILQELQNVRCRNAG